MSNMTPNQMRKKADEIEAAGGPMALERANKLRDDANDMESGAYEADRKAGKLNNKGGMIGYKQGGMPDLTGDGKVTRADVLKGRGVFKKGGKVPKGMHMMPDGRMMKDSEHKKPKKPTKPKKMMGGGTMKYAHGGSVDGIAQRGKTKGRMC